MRLLHTVDRADRGLDLGGVHGRTLDLEHVVEPAVEPEVAVGVERAEIAGRVPTVGVERLCRASGRRCRA